MYDREYVKDIFELQTEACYDLSSSQITNATSAVTKESQKKKIQA